MKCRSRGAKLADVTSSYIYVLFGFFAHLYIILAGSIYFALEQEITLYLGISKQTLINYFSFFSIILLIISLSLKWTQPIYIEQLMIVFFIWILIHNLIPKECLCCATTQLSSQHSLLLLLKDAAGPTLSPIPDANTTKVNTTATAIALEEEELDPPPTQPECPIQHFETIYSILCVIVMISSFMMHAHSYVVSIFFTVLGIVLMIFTTLVPIACNQIDVASANTQLIKVTLYSIIWFHNRRRRLTEEGLSAQYYKSIRILYSYEDCQQNHLLCGVKHHKKHKKNYKSITSNSRILPKKGGKAMQQHCTDTCDDIAWFMGGEEDECLIPRPLFQNLDELCRVVIKQHRPRCEKAAITANDKVRNFAWQLHQMIKIQQINHTFNDKRWFGNFFSWKHRFYDTDMLNLFDLTKTLWILNVCPIFLLFVPLEYCLITCHINWNIEELRCLIERVKVMSHIQCGSAG